MQQIQGMCVMTDQESLKLGSEGLLHETVNGELKLQQRLYVLKIEGTWMPLLESCRHGEELAKERICVFYMCHCCRGGVTQVSLEPVQLQH